MTMKSTFLTLAFGLAVLASAPLWARPNNAAKETAPRYDTATEAVIKGTVAEVKDRECPVSGGRLGSHIVLKLGDGTTIEVHLAPKKFVSDYDLTFKPGDELEVTGSKVTFEGVQTIFAREVKRGSDVFVFRDKDGKPVW